MGSRTGANFLLDGTVQWSRSRSGQSLLRITPELIRVSTGELIWSTPYDLEFDDIFEIQSTIAGQIVEALSIEITEYEQEALSAAQTENQEAYEYYLRGHEFMDRGETPDYFALAEAQLTKAVELDPDFADAWALLARVHLETYWFYYDRSEERLSRAEQAIGNAERLNPGSLNVHQALGRYYYTLLEYDQALEHYNYILEHQPNDAYTHKYVGYVHRRQGDMEGTLTSLLKSFELSPDPVTSRCIGETYLLMRRYSDALEYLDFAARDQPDVERTHWNLGYKSLMSNGDIEAAQAAVSNGRMYISVDRMNLLAHISILTHVCAGDYQTALHEISTYTRDVIDDQFFYVPMSLLRAQIFGLLDDELNERQQYADAKKHIEQALLERPDDSRLYSALGIACAGLGLEEDALEAGRRATAILPVEKEALNGYFREVDLAYVYLLVGMYDEAIAKLEYLLERPGCLSTSLLRIDPRWGPLQNLPGFEALLRKYK